MKPVRFPESETSDPEKSSQILAKTWILKALCAAFLSFWVGALGVDALMCPSEDLFTASSIPILTQVSMAAADLTPPHKPSAAHF